MSAPTNSPESIADFHGSLYDEVQFLRVVPPEVLFVGVSAPVLAPSNPDVHEQQEVIVIHDDEIEFLRVEQPVPMEVDEEEDDREDDTDEIEVTMVVEAVEHRK